MMKRNLATLSATIVGIALIRVPRRLTPERLRPLKQCKSSCMNLLSVPRGQALKVLVQLQFALGVPGLFVFKPPIGELGVVCRQRQIP